LSEEDFETLEDHQLQIQNMMGSRYLATFEEQVTKWQHDLASVADVVGLMSEIQRTWAYLETLFIGSEEVKKELPVDAERFVGIDVDVKQVLQFLTWLSFCTKFTWFICATAVKTNVPIVCPTLSDASDIWTRCSRTSVE
jgi:dynein heavy chain